MKIAVIDNGSRYLTELIHFAVDSNSNDVQIFSISQIDLNKLNEFDLIILSVAVKDPIALNPQKYQAEIDLIQNSTKPILGVCMGFEIIAYVLGSELERMDHKESRTLTLSWLTRSPMAEFFNTIGVQEHHQWKIKTLGKELFVMAESDDGIEIIKHKEKPIYGFQFHPELNNSVNPSILNYLAKEKPDHF